MGKAIIVRDFPEELHYELKIQAAINREPLKALIVRYCQEGLEREKKVQKRGTKKEGG